jgi:hypothetical protein
MANKLSIWRERIERFSAPPHRIWSQRRKDGEVQIRISQPIYFWLLLVSVVVYAFFPVRLLAIPWLGLLGIILTGFV